MLSSPEYFSLFWWLNMTPLRVLWAGSEFVYVFFILSGFALTGTATRFGFDWMAYFKARFVRLYLPVWASIILAWLSITSVERQLNGLGSSLLSRRADTYDWEQLRSDATLEFGKYDFTLNSLWSLRWEVTLLALLPVYVWVFLRFHRQIFVALFLITLAISVGLAMDWTEFVYLPMFGLGRLL